MDYFAGSSTGQHEGPFVPRDVMAGESGVITSLGTLWSISRGDFMVLLPLQFDLLKRNRNKLQMARLNPNSFQKT